jgi:peptidyl-prolyl cis-trans isomerase SurA
MHPSISAPQRRLRGAVLASVLLGAGVVAACRSTPAPPAAPAAIAADTWATVAGRDIKRDEVEKAFRRIADANQPLSDEEALTAKLGILDDMIVETILVSRADQLKVTVPESDVDAALADAKKNIPDADFQQELTKRNLTEADMRESLRRQLIANKVIQQEVAGKITVTDQEVTSFFDANRAQFNLAEDAYHLAQIVVTPVREPQPANRTGDDAATPQAAAAKVQMVMERLKGGSPFGDVARDYSEDPESTPRGGDLGLVPLSALKQAPAPLRDAVFQMTPGSARVVTQGGAHRIMYLVAKEPAGQRDLSSPGVKERITEGLKGRREQLLRTAYLTAARTDAGVVNHLARRVVESQGKVPANP